MDLSKIEAEVKSLKLNRDGSSDANYRNNRDAERVFAICFELIDSLKPKLKAVKHVPPPEPVKKVEAKVVVVENKTKVEPKKKSSVFKRKKK